jgi:hypothetical protein
MKSSTVASVITATLPTTGLTALPALSWGIVPLKSPRNSPKALDSKQLQELTAHLTEKTRSHQQESET